jgi:hypothetical protein
LLESALPEYRELVGEKCAGVLGRAHKVEIEAVVAALGSPQAILRPALGTTHA